MMRMPYTDLLQRWDEAVQALDAKDWCGALAKLEQISQPTSRTLFNAAVAHLSLQQLDLALQDLDLAIAKDERFSLGFFQRAAVLMQIDRLEDALSDCILAQKHMRGNTVIDYRQLGLQFKLNSWQVLYNASAVYSRMGDWEQAREVLLSLSQERGGRGGQVEVALDQVMRAEVLAPLMVPEGVVFRPRKQDVEQLKQRDFLGKAKVISSVIPNDDFGGFEPLRMQKPGFYQPKSEEDQESRYMVVKSPYMARGPAQLTVPGGATVFLYAEEDRNGMATVIYDGQRGLLPVSLLQPANTKSRKSKKDKVPSGIPLPPGLKPPCRPESQLSSATPPRDSPSPSYTSTMETPPPPSYAAAIQHALQGAPEGSVVVKVHYTYTVAVAVPPETPLQSLKDQIAQKVSRPASDLRLRRRLHGSQVLTPLDGPLESGCTVQELSEEGRATLWCQAENPLLNRTILYQMVALYDYTAQGSEDLEFSEGDTIDVLGEVNESWLEGHCGGLIGIFPSCFAYREEAAITQSSEL